MMTQDKINWDEIDWKDDSGLIAFIEWEKRNKIRKMIEEDINKVSELTPDDWILILLYANNCSLTKTLIIKYSCIFSERTGLSDMYVFSYHDFNILSDVIERALKYLITTDKLILFISSDKDGYISKTYKIKDLNHAKYLWSLLPHSIIGVIHELKSEFGNKSVWEIIDYVNDAYPEYGSYDGYWRKN